MAEEEKRRRGLQLKQLGTNKETKNAYIHTHTHTHTHTQACTHTPTHIHTHKHIQAHTYTYVPTYVGDHTERQYYLLPSRCGLIPPATLLSISS